MDLSYEDIQEIYNLTISQIKDVEKKSGRLITDSIDIVHLSDGVAILFDIAELELEDELMMSVYSATCEDVDALGKNTERFTVKIKDDETFTEEADRDDNF